MFLHLSLIFLDGVHELNKLFRCACQLDKTVLEELLCCRSCRWLGMTERTVFVPLFGERRGGRLGTGGTTCRCSSTGGYLEWWWEAEPSDDSKERSILLEELRGSRGALPRPSRWRWCPGTRCQPCCRSPCHGWVREPSRREYLPRSSSFVPTL